MDQSQRPPPKKKKKTKQNKTKKQKEKKKKKQELGQQPIQKGHTAIIIGPWKRQNGEKYF